MAQMTKFDVAVDGGDKVRVVASTLDYIRAERELKASLFKALESGMLEPILDLAYKASQRALILPDGMTFDEFLERTDVEFITDEDDSGNV